MEIHPVLKNISMWPSNGHTKLSSILQLEGGRKDNRGKSHMKKENHILCAVQSEKTKGYFSFLQALWVGCYKAAQPLTNKSHLWAAILPLPVAMAVQMLSNSHFHLLVGNSGGTMWSFTHLSLLKTNYISTSLCLFRFFLLIWRKEQSL